MEFTKSDLENGMIIEWRNGSKFLVIGTQALHLGGHHSLDSYTEDLRDICCNKNYDIVKVYKTENDCITLKSLFDYLELVWERKPEIDWSKVPEWTKCQYKDNNTWRNCYYLGYRVDINPYSCEFTLFDPFTSSNNFNGRQYRAPEKFKLHPSVEIQPEWLF